jgi:hypothetical protein
MNKSYIYEEAIIEALKNMSVQFFEGILTDGKHYGGRSKKTIINELLSLYQKAKDRGDSFFNVEYGRCHGCLSGNTGYILTGNVTKNRTGYIIVFSNRGNISSITLCRRLATAEECISPEFQKFKEIPFDVWRGKK